MRSVHNGGIEAILDPNLLICDPHHHLWDRPSSRYMPDELKADVASGHRVEKTVFIECKSGYREEGPESFRPVGETEFVVASEPDGLIAGIISYVDLREPDVRDVLAAHRDAGKGRFRGIRNISAWDQSDEVRVPTSTVPPGLLSDADFRRGFAELGRAGLVFDAFLFHPQLPEFIDLARAFPEVSIVLEHIGGPVGIGPYAARRTETLDSWREAMDQVATCPNVVLKLGGIGMPHYGMDWHTRPEGASSEEIVEVWGDEFRRLIECFGVERCMFESNFPVDNASVRYPTLWNAFKRMVADASSAEKAALFHDTAVRTYSL